MKPVVVSGEGDSAIDGAVTLIDLFLRRRWHDEQTRNVTVALLEEDDTIKVKFVTETG